MAQSELLKNKISRGQPLWEKDREEGYRAKERGAEALSVRRPQRALNLTSKPVTTAHTMVPFGLALGRGET